MQRFENMPDRSVITRSNNAGDPSEALSTILSGPSHVAT